MILRKDGSRYWSRRPLSRFSSIPTEDLWYLKVLIISQTADSPFHSSRAVVTFSSTIHSAYYYIFEVGVRNEEYL